MDIIEVCPSCGGLGVEVGSITVKSLLKDDLKSEDRKLAKNGIFVLVKIVIRYIFLMRKNILKMMLGV